MIGSDIYLMVPVGGKINTKIIDRIEKDAVISEYIDVLNSTSLYECDNKVSSVLNRVNLGTIELSYFINDKYEDDNITWIASNLVYTYHENTALGILQFIVYNCKQEDSQIGDMISSNHLIIKIGEKKYKLSELLDALSLKQYGKIRTINCNSVSKKDKTFKYTLIGETANSEHLPYHINDKYFETVGVTDCSKYNFYELYTDEKNVVYLLKDFSDNYVDNIENETLLIFICEIAVFQNAAVSRINSQIIDELIANSNISSQKSLKLQVEYGKTILFWDNNIFNYHAAQELSNDIVSAFKTKELMEEYKKNSKHLEQIASLKSGITANIEAKVLNTLAFILSISQMFELFNNIKNVIAGKEWQFGIMSSSVILLVVIIIVIRNNLNNRREK